MHLSCWSATYPVELTASFTSLFDEISLGVEARLFGAGGGGGSRQKAERWQETLHAQADKKVALLAEHLAHLHRVTRKTAQSRLQLGGLRGRLKVQEAMFGDQHFASKLESVINSFNLTHLLPNLGKPYDLTPETLEDDDGEEGEAESLRKKDVGAAFSPGKRTREPEGDGSSKKRKL